MRKTAIFFLILLLSVRIPLVNSAPDEGYGEANDNLGQFTDTFEDLNNVSVRYNIERNVTLNALELDYMSGVARYEDFTTYRELDPLGKIDIISPINFTWTQISREIRTYYLTKTYPVGNFGQDFIFTWMAELTEIEAGDGDSRDYGYMVCFGNTLNNPLTDPRITTSFVQDGADDNQYFIEIRIDDVHAGWDGDKSIVLDVAVMYYFNLTRIGGNDITLEIRTVSFDGPLKDTLVVSIPSFNDDFRYIFAHYTKGGTQDQGDWNSGTLQVLWNNTGVDQYAEEGYFTTEDYLNYTSGQSLNLLTNATLPLGTGITVQFSSDNNTWVDNHGAPGSTTLEAGFFAIDLRDLNYTDIFTRGNFSGPGFETPRLYQLRLVTTNGTDGGAPISGVTIIESDAPWIALAIILSIISFLLATGIRR